jgi:hypothetical protein
MADRTLLQELFEYAPSIQQEQLREFLKLKERVRLAKVDLVGVEHELETMLILGSPTEPGPLTVTLVNGKAVVSEVAVPEEEEIGDIPF